MSEREGSPNRRRAERRAAGASVPNGARTRVLLVEDNRLMRDGLARLLGAYPEIDLIGAVDNANAATQQLKDLKPQVVLLDAALANGDSHAFLTNLKSIAPQAKTIMMDFVPAQQDVHEFIDGGANGFIMKDATAEDIVKAIRSVASGTDLPLPDVPRRQPGDAPAHASGGGGGGGGGGGSAAQGNVRLTKREQEIKELIAAGLGNKEIAQRLNIATNTVKSHVHNMLGKLAALTPPDRRTRTRGGRRTSSRRSYRFLR